MKLLLTGAICGAMAMGALTAQRAPVLDHTLTGRWTGSAGLLFSREAARLAVTSGSEAERRISIWDTGSGRLVSTIDPGGRGVAAQFSPGGKCLATSARGGEAGIWDTGSGKSVLPSGFDDILFDSTGSTALVQSAGVTRLVRLGEADEGKPVAISQAVGSGNRFLGVTREGAVQAWQWSPLALRAELGRLSGGTLIQRSDSSPDGCLVITSTASPPKEVQLWDVCHGRGLGTVTGNPFFYDRAALTPDASLLLTAGDGLVRLCPIGSSTAPATVKIAGTVAAASPGASRLAVWTGNGLELRDSGKGQLIAKLTGFEGRPAVRFSPDGRWLVTVVEFALARLWDARSGKEVATFGAAGQSKSVNLAVFSPEGARLALALGDGTVELWSLDPLRP